MSVYTDIIKLLPSLSQRELNDVRQQCQFRLQKSRAMAPVEDEDWLFIGIISELQQRNLYVPLGAVKPKSYGKFSTISTEVRRLLELAAPGLTGAVERRALGQVAAKALADYLSDGKFSSELSFQHMLLHVSLTPTAVERAYPGYMAAQLLGWTIRGRDAR